ncbi:MAG: TetR/AcrR family transcriptional regulator [Deltaproteobacteria bacterium]|nr:TetR/AcrR family transcriptional regulator [Deltaproteobacteria bacterium]
MNRVTTQVENPELVSKRHEQIYNAVVDLFGRYGYQKTSMRDISKASGINLSYLYKYVSSKNDVLYIFYEGVSRIYAHIYNELAEPTDADAIQQLERFISDVLHLIHDNKNTLRSMWTESRHLEAEWLKAVLDKEAYMVECVEKLLLRGIRHGSFDINDSFMAANLIQYMMFLEPMKWWNLKQRYSVDQMIEEVTGFILRALGVDRGPRLSTRES